MLVGCGYKDELKYRQHKRASSKIEATIMDTMATRIKTNTRITFTRVDLSDFIERNVHIYINYHTHLLLTNFQI